MEGGVEGIGCIIVSLGIANGIPLASGGHNRAMPSNKPLAVFVASFTFINLHCRISRHNNSHAGREQGEDVVQLLLLPRTT
jgi:hypothetical protein